MTEAEKRIREALSVASIEPRDERFEVDTDDLTALLADQAALRAEVERLKAAIDMQPSPPTREDMEWAGKVHLAKAENDNWALRAEVEALRADAERFASFAFPPFCDEYAGVDLYDQASIYASAFGREEPNRNDYVAALRDAVDAAMAQAKDAEAR